MAYKMAGPKAPPSTATPPKPAEVQKDSSAAANRDELRKKEPPPQTEEYGYIVTNQRCSELASST